MVEFTYKNKKYRLAELIEPQTNKTYDVIAIFEITHPEQKYPEIENLHFVNYFAGANCWSEEEMLNIAKGYIDRY